MLYPILMALNSVFLFGLAVLWEITLRPVNPAVPIGLIFAALVGFLIAAHEARA